MPGNQNSGGLKTKVAALFESILAYVCLYYFPKWIVRVFLSVSVTSEILKYYIYGLNDRKLLSPLLLIGVSVTAWFFIAMWCAVRQRDMGREKAVGKRSVSGVFLSAALGFGASQLVMVFSLLFSESWQELYANSMSYVLKNQKSGIVLITELVAYVVAAPITEEWIFRGVIYGKLRKEFSVLVSVFITSVLFAFIHNSNIQIIYAFLIGIILCLLRERYGSIKTTMVFHMVFNLFGSGLIFSELAAGWVYFGGAVFVISGILIIVDVKKNSRTEE